MDIAEQIKLNKTAIGIEFGSTRIKAVLIGEDHMPVASGTHDWENRLENGVWTYSGDDIRTGLTSCFASLMSDVRSKYGVALTSTGSMGISAMMHGYLAFDEKDELLVPFRTWRNTMTGEAAGKLTALFGFNIPQRWSIAHLYQAILNKEPHIGRIRSINTLAGYVHYLLTGERVIGIGDASGMFPIDPDTKNYNTGYASAFDNEVSAHGIKILDVLPKIVPVGECAGKLTESGAALLDPTGTFSAGVPLCPPEGDAQTGMAATNSIAPKTGNVSAGTSIFAMAVLEKGLSKVYPQIDIVTTPCGDPVAMVHCNNCSGDIDAWVRLFGEVLKMAGAEVSKPRLYDMLYAAALEGDASCGGVVSCNYFSGEHVTGFTKGMPMMMREPDAAFNASNVMRSLVYSAMATLKTGMDILMKEEKITLEKIYAHGGLFKSPVTGQRFLAAALGVPVTVMETAAEGGAWGIALLAAYEAREDKSVSLPEYLDSSVFKDTKGSSMAPDDGDIRGFDEYMVSYRRCLGAEAAAVAE